MNRRTAVKNLLIASGGTISRPELSKKRMKKNIAFAALIAIFLSCSETILAQKPLYKAAFGMAPYTFRKSFANNIAATLDTIKMMGFTEIEGGGERMPAEEYKKLCDDRGISIPGSSASYEQLTRSVQSLDSVVSRTKILGAKYIMCSWIPHKNGVLTFEDAKKRLMILIKPGKF
ncbi:MAG: hypothetical protein ABUL41_00550 [Chitinophagaceae bacterium]